jgi:hypothetical protein
MNRSISVTRKTAARVGAPLLLVLAGLALAGCETTGTGPGPVAQAAPQPPLTHAQAAEQCWMSTERGHADMDLDKRADIVTQCIKDKMKDMPATPAAKS